MKSIQEKDAIIHQRLCRAWWNDGRIQTTAGHWLHSTIPRCLIISFGFNPPTPFFFFCLSRLHSFTFCCSAVMCCHALWNYQQRRSDNLYCTTLFETTCSLFICFCLGVVKCKSVRFITGPPNKMDHINYHCECILFISPPVQWR